MLLSLATPWRGLSPARGGTSPPGAVETSVVAPRSPSPSPSWPRPCEKPAALVHSPQPYAPRVAVSPGAPKGQEDVPTAEATPAFRGAPEPPATPAWIYTRWPFAARRGSGPVAGSETIPSPPCFVIKSNPSGLHRGRLLFEIPLRAEPGLAAGHGGILPPSLPPAPSPSCLSLFCVSPLLGGAGGGAGFFQAAFVQRGAARVSPWDHYATALPAGPV